VVIKILAICLALIGLRRLVVRVRRGAARPFELFFWALVFLGLGLVAFIPKQADALAQAIGVSSGFNALTFLAIAVLLLAVYRLLARTAQLEQEVTRLVRALALQGQEGLEAGPGPRAAAPDPAPRSERA
jgi:hypothetical protein